MSDVEIESRMSASELPKVPESRFDLGKRLTSEHLSRFSQETICAMRTVLMVGRALRSVEVAEKVATKNEGVLNLVTIWDETSRDIISAELKKHFPQDPLLSEEVEDKPKTPQILERLWVVDELDGTFNASEGINYFAVAVGFVKDGKAISGAIYFPPVDQLYYGEVGVGSFRDGLAVKKNTSVELSKSSITTNASYTFETADRHLEMLKACGSPRMTVCGATVLSLAEVALGRHGLGFALDAKPWDKAAPMALMHAAGVPVRGIDGRENVSIFDKDILVGNRRLIAQFLEAVKPLLRKWNFTPEENL